jgi:hypothetical protein
MTNYPVMFTFRDAVSGNGFLSGVTLGGRALIVHEKNDDLWWIYGVRPAAIAESGKTPLEAFANFRNTYKNVLFDFAEDAKTFDAFKRDVEQFYSESDHDEEARWVAAFQAIRTGDAAIEPPFTEIPKASPEDRPSFISVLPISEMNRYSASDNVPDSIALAKAA